MMYRQVHTINKYSTNEMMYVMDHILNVFQAFECMAILFVLYLDFFLIEFCIDFAPDETSLLKLQSEMPGKTIRESPINDLDTHLALQKLTIYVNNLF